MAANFVTNAALGIIARTVPQMNIFAIGFPLKISVGLVLISFVLPMLSAILINFFANMARNLDTLLLFLN